MTNEEFLKSITLEGEMWKDVAGYEGCYMVSNFGRVMSLGREVPNSDKSNRIIRPSIMSLNIKNAKRKSSIYQTYTAHLCKNRIRKAITVHRLVACAFIENPNNYPSIDHIDGNPMNNHVSNLRWRTNTINMNNPITRSRISLSKKGKYNTPKSMPVVQIMNGELINTFPSIMEATRHGFTHSSVLQCCRGKLHHHKGFEWMFLSDYKNLINKSKNSSLTDHD